MQFEKPTPGRMAFSVLSIVLLIGAFHFFQEALSHKKGGIELVGGETVQERWVWIDSPAFQRHALVSALILAILALMIAQGAWIKRNDEDSN